MIDLNGVDSGEDTGSCAELICGTAVLHLSS